MSYYIILYHIIIFINAHPSVFSPGVATTGSWWILWDVLEPDSPASPRMSGKLWMWEISGWTNWKCPEISGVLEFQTIFFFRKNITENLSCQTGSPSAVLMKNWVSETLATFSSSWSSTSSALWSSVNKTQSCRISGICWGFLHCPRHTCLIGKPKPGVGKTMQNFLLVFLNRSPYAESCRTFSHRNSLEGPVLQLLPGVLERLWLHLRLQPEMNWDSRKPENVGPIRTAASLCQVITSDIVSILEASIAGDATVRGIQWRVSF